MDKSFKSMPIWIEAMSAAEMIFRHTQKLPRKEDYGITSQLRRSAVSVAGNIAEAHGRHHVKDKIYFYFIARGSAMETQSHLEYARRVGYLGTEVVVVLDAKLSRIHHDLNKIIKTLRSRENKD
jgi:four helix bundle protein